jgi:phosphatidate cytidylyltransferase
MEGFQMKVRIISGIVAVALVTCLMFLGKEVFHIVSVILAFITLNELFDAFEAKGYKPLRIAGYLACVCLLFGSIGMWNRIDYRWLINTIDFTDVRTILYVALILMLTIMVFSKGKFSVADLSFTILCSFYICFLFWYVMLLRDLPSGMYVVGFVIIGAVSTDTFAFFVGTLFGRNKLLPDVGPKKTVEGAIGGILGCVVMFLLYGLIFKEFIFDVSIIKLLIMGVACGFVSEIGDLAASAIKRFCGIKDFGKMIPGHGGILDRLDSILILAPLIYIFFT